jgi:hypothetical protein
LDLTRVGLEFPSTLEIKGVNIDSFVDHCHNKLLERMRFISVL